MKNKEIIATLLLGIVLLISILNECVSERKSNNFEKQIEQDLDLSKAYGETNARWLELNEMLQRNLLSVLGGNWNKTVESSGKFKKERFSKEEWEIWKNKTVKEFWEHRYHTAWENLRKSIDDTNEKRKRQENFIHKNKSFNFLDSFLRILQILITALALVLYVQIVKESRAQKNK